MKLSTLKIVAAILPVIALAGGALAANPLTSQAFKTVKVDGSAGFSNGAAVSVVQTGSAYEMFYRDANTDDGSISQLRHAVSTDGVNFVSSGITGTFGVDPFAGGTAPYLYYENVSRVGTNLKVQHWTYDGGEGSFSNYRYNISISDAGPTGTGAYVHQGPISPYANGFGGNVAGSFGIVGGNIYTYTGGRTLSRAAYTDGTPPTVPGQTQIADFQPLFDSLGISNGYINNHSDVLALGGNSLGFYFTVRDDIAVGNRVNQQIYYSESTDGGASWSAATGILSSPTLDGGAFGGNFAHADAVNGGLYISSKDLAGNFIIATTVVPEPTTLAALGAASAFGLRRRRRA